MVTSATEENSMMSFISSSEAERRITKPLLQTSRSCKPSVYLDVTKRWGDRNGTYVQNNILKRIKQMRQIK
jgi:hypothetical protein